AGAAVEQGGTARGNSDRAADGEARGGAVFDDLRDGGPDGGADERHPATRAGVGNGAGVVDGACRSEGNSVGDRAVVVEDEVTGARRAPGQGKQLGSAGVAVGEGG